jgi:exopolysaccharide production protein ExoZ
LKSHLESIQHLRGIAALLVVFVHFPTPLARFCGSIGVDIFFFISGFIIFISIDKSVYYDQPFTFLKKRLLRIVPLYCVVTALFLLMNITLNSFHAKREAKIPVDMNSMTVIKSFLFIPITSDGYYRDPLVFLGWSLNFEMLFYIFTSLILIIFRRKFFIPLVSLLILLGSTSFVIGDFKNVLLDFFTSPLLLYFAIGLLLGKYHQIIKERISPFVEPLFFIVLYIFFIVMIAKDTGYTYKGMPREMVVYNGKVIPRILIWGIPSFILLISYFTLASKYKISNAYLSKLGDRSYSIYLLQIFFIYFLYEFSSKFDRSGSIWLSMGMIATLVWISGFSYKYFEKRFHRLY